jgi:hypothetical protein
MNILFCEFRMEHKVASTGRELLMTFIALLIALLFSALALGIANWGIGVLASLGTRQKLLR